MPALLAAIEQALAAILNVLGISQLMYGLLQQFGVVISTAAQEHYRYEIQGYTLAANNQLADATFGLAAIKTELDGIGLAIIALGNPQQTAQPVTLPSTPPAGYGGATASAAAAAVWSFVSTDESTQMGVIMSAQSVFLRVVRDSLGFEQRIGQRFLVSFDPFSLVDNPNTSFPSHSAAEILTTDDTLLDFLQRIEPGWTWNQLGDGTYWAAQPGTAGGALMYAAITPGEFAWFKATNGGKLPTVNVPPVWPGLSNVTYGGTQSMDAPNGQLDGPADGYHIVIDATPSWAGKFDFGVVQSWRNVGAIAFLDDEGVPEPAQTLGFANVIYTPQRMTHSDGALYRIATGYHCTATAFTINS
jgi:hypothetical protein